MAKWGAGLFGVEVHKGKGNSRYLRFGCQSCGRATPQLCDGESYNEIFDSVFGLDMTLAKF
jgi:hypothetical protein